MEKKSEFWNEKKKLSLYAIVDIETTGSHPSANGITEIAIVLHNGMEEEGRYSTLVNPGIPIPRFVSQLTGIYEHTVAAAPPFEQVAEKVFQLLRHRIFVAHNVNFDHTFLKYHLEKAGYEINTKKICTVRMARRAFPGFRKYGLSSITQELGIPHSNKHRAMGDAEATSILFRKCVDSGGEFLVKEMLKKHNQDHILPANLPREYVKQLPSEPGVYYFHDARGKVIYVGKAKSIKQRVISHFTGYDASRKRQELLKNVYSISCEVTGTEFTAGILESVEIKRLWPVYNQSQKIFEQVYGLYLFEDRQGFLRLAIDKKRKHTSCLHSFSNLTEAHALLWQMINLYSLNPYLCFISKVEQEESASPEEYNKRVNEALTWLNNQKETWYSVEKLDQYQVFVLVEKGQFYGMGQMDATYRPRSLNDLKKRMKQYPENDVIKSMLRLYRDKNAAQIQVLPE